MRFLAIAAVCIAAWAPVSMAQDQPATAKPEGTAVPAELEGIAKILGNEKEVIDAAYAFQRVQFGLAKWDEQMARDIGLKGGPNSEKDAQAMLDSAFHRRELIAKAWSMIYEKYPDNPRAMTYYGAVLYYALGRQPDALIMWNKAMAIDGKLADPVNELMSHYFHAGDYENGWRMLEKVKDLAPEDPNVLFNVTQMYFTYHDQAARRYKWEPAKVYKEAMKMSKKAKDLAPGDFELNQDYANNFFAAENMGVSANWNEAADAWKHARSLAPNEHSLKFTWLNEARSAIRAGDRARAEACLNETLKIDPKNIAATNLLTRLDAQIEKHKLAAKR